MAGGAARCVRVAVWVSRTRDASVDFCSLISLGTVSDLLAAALQHGAAKRVVLVVVELTTYSSGRALPLVYSTQQPSGLQREQSRATVPSMSRSAEEGSTFKAPTNLPIPPPFTLQAKRSAADAYCRTKHSTARRGRRARCAHKRKALCLIAAPGGAGLVPTLLELYLFAAIFFLRIFPPFGCATQQL